MGALSINRNHGFSIISATIAMSMMSAGMLMMTEFMTTLSKNQKGVQTLADFETIKSNIKRIVDRSDLCANAFFASDGVTRARFNPLISIPEKEQLYVIKARDAQVVAKDQNLSQLRISNLGFEMLAGTDPDTTSVPGRTVYQVKLNIAAERMGGTLGAQELSNSQNPPQISLVTLSSNDQIESCASSEAEEMCESMGGNWNPGRNPPCQVQRGFKFVDRRWTGYLNNWDEPVNRVPVPDLVMTGYDTYHHDHYEDNQISFQVAEALDGDVPLVFGRCTNTATQFTGGFVNNYFGAVNYSCPGNTFMVNERSVHSNAREDRVYNYDCCSLRSGDQGAEIQKGACEWSGWENYYNLPVKFECSEGKIMAGVESLFHVGYHDRMYRFQCCGKE